MPMSGLKWPGAVGTQLPLGICPGPEGLCGDWVGPCVRAPVIGGLLGGATSVKEDWEPRVGAGGWGCGNTDHVGLRRVGSAVGITVGGFTPHREDMP